MILLNPNARQRTYDDGTTDDIMRKTIAFFESKGKVRLKSDDRERVWYADFLAFQKENQIFAQLLTPSNYAGSAGCRWDTNRNCEFNEILGFYGLPYWYTWQVTILGLGPIWISDNDAVKRATAEHLRQGGIFGFGLSEKTHGADIYSTGVRLEPQADGTYLANGNKYYIGNGNEAALLSTLGKIVPAGAESTEKYADFAFFVNTTTHEAYKLIKNVVNSQSYVAEYRLEDYPITEAEILSKGRDAWDMALNTVNIGKYNLGWASIGICTHAFYEAINHAAGRNLYGKYVTDFPHVKRLFVDAYCRLVSMKAFALRTKDYIRSASAEDRRYLLYTPLVKMKVTTQGEEVIDNLWDVIAAKGFEKDMYFDMATRDIRALPKLEGTVAVNMALVVKFMQNYFFNPGQFNHVPVAEAPVNDDFLFNQGPTKGLGNTQFHDYNIAYDSVDLPNVNVFQEQIALFKQFMLVSMSDPRAVERQARDIDFLLTMGEIFSLVAYGQLIIEFAQTSDDVDDDLLDLIFDVMVRDFSKFALQLHSKPTCTDAQSTAGLAMIRKSVFDAAGYDKVWTEQVYALRDVYEMRP
ncbi:MAG: acyl-CoA dehydrogenase [Kiritimatiellia bacterium]|jgi:acyl-CoA dehydrogenase